MKKYLMTGVAALAFAATFTSCSNHDGVEYDPQAQVKDSYKTAFVNAFGQPAKSQDWGFGSLSGAATRANTRTINVNGNLWPDYPTLGATEEQDVYTYVRNLTTLPNVKPDQLENYFVTQVHKGFTDTYTDLDGHTIDTGSDLMNNLHIAMKSDAVINANGKLSKEGKDGWEHINNFNAGNNTDWHGNTLVIGGGTFDFAYHCATDSRYHNSWIAVNGADIDEALGVSKYAGYWYICFDYEATQPGVKTRAEVRMPNPDRETEIWVENYVFDGAETEESLAGKTVDFRGYQLTLTTENTTVKGYENGNMVVIGNKKYDDWIIRLVAAEPVQESYDVRIVAEDLNASQDTDFDFNDVVFDVKYDDANAASTGAKIRVVAAGGTLPLYVADHEVHALFQEANQDKTITTKTMINTYAGKHNEYKYAYFTISSGLKPAEHGRDIEIVVKKPNADGVETPYVLTAEAGEPAAKIAVLPTFQYCDEFASIKGTFIKFVDWVKQGPSVKWYYAETGLPVDK